MIEIQLNDPRVYEKLKDYASYRSDITRVCAFRDDMAAMLASNGVVLDGEVSEREVVKASLSITNRRVMELQNASPEMLHFLSVRSEFDPTIPVGKMHEVHKLIESGLVDVNPKFNELYSHLGYRDKISELICSSIKFYNKGRITDFIDGDLTITSMNFNKLREKEIVYSQVELTVTSPLTQEGRTKQFRAVDVENPERIFFLKFYNTPQILRSIAFEGNRISVAMSKILQVGKYLTSTDPIILPIGLNWRKDTLYRPITRQIPADLVRTAFYEFLYRNSVDKV